MVSSLMTPDSLDSPDASGSSAMRGVLFAGKSQSFASSENNCMARAAAWFGVNVSNSPLDAQYLFVQSEFPQPVDNW